MQITRAMTVVLIAGQMTWPSPATSGARPSRGDCSQCAGMTWVTTSCDGFYGVWFDSKELTDINDMPANVRARLAAHLKSRLGKYAAELKFARAYYVDVDGYFSRHADEERRPGWPFSYDVQFTLSLSTDGPVEFCAQIGLDQNGGVLKEINLPDLAKHPERGQVLGASQLLALAETLGVQIEKAMLDLKYDAKDEELEYQVEYGIDPKDDGNNLGILYVTAHDPKSYRWFRTKRFARIDDRPNYRMQVPVCAVTARAQNARPAPAQPAPDAGRYANQADDGQADEAS